MGIISSLGQGVGRHVDALKKNCSGIKPIKLFTPSPGHIFPAGEIPNFRQTLNVPRTHEFALLAAQEALSGTRGVPDSIILGTTTGGIPLTEELLKKDEKDADQYKYHSTASVAEFLAGVLRCRGLVLTVTTACSSGAVAIKLACELLSSGKANCVLAGGADALCRLTYYGFNSLQLIDVKVKQVAPHFGSEIGWIQPQSLNLNASSLHLLQNVTTTKALDRISGDHQV